MKIAYGPPGAVGVKSLQYVSGDDGIGDADYVSANLHRIAKPVGTVALGAWVYAWFTKDESLKKQAFAVSLAAFVVQAVSKP